MHALLYRLADSPEQRLLLSQVIQPIIKHDEQFKSNLMLTLSAVLFSDDLDKNASLIHVHINTVRYRLNKIHALTGFDYFTSEGRVVLVAAFLLYRYKESGL